MTAGIASFLFLIAAGIASAQPGTDSIVLQWDPVLDPRVMGYCIYVGEKSGVYDRFIAVPKATTTKVVVPGFKAGETYFFAATSYLSPFKPPTGTQTKPG